MTTIVVTLRQRDWQKPLIKAYRDGIKHGLVVAHRRAGKDRVACFIELEAMLRERCTAWHALPEQEQARKVVWDNITRDGERLINVAFPYEIRKGEPNATEMKVTLINGSMWQLIGADRIRSIVGPNPKHVTFSEFALTNPLSRHFIRPILAENGGSELMITTPRGYNHAFETYKYAQHSPLWYSAIHPVGQTKLIAQEELDELRRTTPDEIYRQEYDCDWSAANIGSILGSYIEKAERDGRVDVPDLFDPEHPVYAAADIGRRDATSFWFWQPVVGGWFIINNETASGWDAEKWCDHLQTFPYKYAKIYLPHDARSRTFSAKRSTLDTFMAAFGAGTIRVLPQMDVEDRVNAARMVVKFCKFTPECSSALIALRSWSYEYNEDTKAFSREPKHDWCSDYGDGFSYFAAIAEEGKALEKPPGRFVYKQPAHEAFTLDGLWKDRELGRGAVKGL